MMNTMGSSIGGVMGNGMMQTNYNQPSFGEASNQHMQNAQGGMGGQPQGQAGRMIYCAKCSKKHLTTEMFCPHCGNKYNPCPSCGSDNLENAKRCVTCGTILQGNNAQTSSICRKCGAALAPGVAFCSNCGQPTMGNQDNQCPRCGTPLGPSVKFCPNCGYKR